MRLGLLVAFLMLAAVSAQMTAEEISRSGEIMPEIELTETGDAGVHGEHNIPPPSEGAEHGSHNIPAPPGTSGTSSGKKASFLQKSSTKEVNAKHAAANKAASAAHKKADAITGKLHKGLVGQVVSNTSTKAAKKMAKANKKAAAAGAAIEKKWAKKEAHFRHLASKLNKKQRKLARGMEVSVKNAKKALLSDTARSLRSIARANKKQKELTNKSHAFQARMKQMQKGIKGATAMAKLATAKRLAKYKKDMTHNAKRLAAAKAHANKIAEDIRKANLKLTADQATLSAKYNAKMQALGAENAANQKKFDAAKEKSQKAFAAKFAGNKAAAAAATAAIAASVKAANKEAAAKTKKINDRHKKEQAAKKKADSAYAKKTAAAALALKKSRAATAEKFAKKAAKTAREYQKDMQEAGQKKAKADRAAAAEKAAKKKAEKKGKADEKETKIKNRDDLAMKECAIDGSECQTPDGGCKKTTPTGPFMGDDLVSCASKKPAEEEDAGLSWAGIEPPLPPEKCPPASAACHLAMSDCKTDSGCKPGMLKGTAAGLIQVGCHAGKASLTKYFAWASACCDPKNIGFSDNIPMFKMQITNMPVYVNSGTTGRFKANRGAGSVCGMVKSLAAGIAAGDDGGIN